MHFLLQIMASHQQLSKANLFYHVFRGIGNATVYEKCTVCGFAAWNRCCLLYTSCGGSSIGVSIVKEESNFTKALDDAFFWEDEILIEEYVEGREFSVGVIKGRALPVIEIAPKEGFYDYKNKYKAGSTVETCPADIKDSVAKEMQKHAVKVAEALGLDTYSRIRCV